MNAGIGARFHDRPVQLAIAPVASAYQVGQPIKVRVVATGSQDARISEAWVALVMKVWWRGPSVVAGNWGSAPGSPGPQRTVAGDRTPLDLSGDLRAGTRSEREVALPNWAQAPTGGQRPGRRIEYFIRAGAELAGGKTVRTEARVLLVSGPDLYRYVEGSHGSRRTRRSDIDVVMPAFRARPGEILRGTVRVTPRQPVRARSVLLCLVRTQNVPPKLKIMWRKALASDAELRSPREFGFAVPIPAEAPTMITPYLNVHWQLRAVVRYGMLAADRLDTEINVFTAAR
jgi:hypothetical protein